MITGSHSNQWVLPERAKARMRMMMAEKTTMSTIMLQTKRHTNTRMGEETDTKSASLLTSQHLN